ncbi:ScaI family restriction endonuclease [Cuspidothrix issatschenkoi LEGE 03284]|nr:ScaI family restriction endonuclease [Cuspidothrix issatschenkoi LEGE 03284]
MVSPYFGITVEKWADKTKELIEQHPLDVNEIYKSSITNKLTIFEK